MSKLRRIKRTHSSTAIPSADREAHWLDDRWNQDDEAPETPQPELDDWQVPLDRYRPSRRDVADMLKDYGNDD